MMIHEKQVRQLCAIHSVNNLLQLPSDWVGDCSDGECNNQCDDSGNGHEYEHNDNVNSQEVGGCSMTDRKCSPNDTSIVHEWTCHGKILNRPKQQKGRSDEPASTDTPSVDSSKIDLKKRQKRPWHAAATQQEFDDISKEFTLREQMLMEGYDPTFLSATSSKEEEKSGGIILSQNRLNNISMMQRIRSQYGTPYFGNYSLEVLQEALKCRGVELEFYRVPNGNNASLNENNANASYETAGQNNASDLSSTSSKCLIGFIIHEKAENRKSPLSYLSCLGSHIPIMKNFCGVGQHWYAITGVRYNQNSSQNASERNKPGNDKEGSNSCWDLVDSNMDGISTFETDKELMDYLRELQSGGGLVFRAFANT